MTKPKFLLFCIFTLGLILRLATSTIGYHGDLNNNISWGKVAFENGFKGFFGSSNSDDWEYSAPNQPPLTILTFAGMIAIERRTSNAIWYLNENLPIFPSGLVWFWESWGTVLLVKLPSILADLGIGWFIYSYFKSKDKLKLGLNLAAIWVFNPITWYNSAVWGQTDAVVNLLGLLAIFYLIKRQLHWFGVLFTLSMLFKGSLGIFIPVLFFYVLLQKYKLKAYLHATCYMLLATFLVSIWFHPYPDLFQWLYSSYTQRFIPGEIGFLTANAFNFWWLVDSGKVNDSTIYLGLSARTWGVLITLLGNVGVMYWLSKKPSEKRLFASLVVISLISFLFMTRIHERYLFPFFPVSTLFLGIVPSFWPIYTFFSLTHLLNLYNLFWVPPFPFLENILTYSWFTTSLALTNIVLFIATLRHFASTKI